MIFGSEYVSPAKNNWNQETRSSAGDGIHLLVNGNDLGSGVCFVRRRIIGIR